MGLKHVTAAIANPIDPQRRAEVKLLVDTGATFSIAPGQVMDELGISRTWTRRMRTADGRLIERDVGTARLDVEGATGDVPVIFGEPSDVMVLGVTGLEILLLEFDPVRGELRPTEALFL